MAASAAGRNSREAEKTEKGVFLQRMQLYPNTPSRKRLTLNSQYNCQLSFKLRCR